MFTPTITVALSVTVEMYQQYHQTGFLQKPTGLSRCKNCSAVAMQNDVIKKRTATTAHK